MLAFYRGTSFFPSRLIRFINWSEYSHVAWIDEQTHECIEAWTRPNGVRLVRNFADHHTPGTVVDLFAISCYYKNYDRVELDVRKYLMSQIGKKYDWQGIFHFILRRHESPESQTKWFCSELISAAYAAAGFPLLVRLPHFKVFPGMLAYSPKLTFVKSVVVPKAEEDLPSLS